MLSTVASELFLIIASKYGWPVAHLAFKERNIGECHYFAKLRRAGVANVQGRLVICDPLHVLDDAVVKLIGACPLTQRGQTKHAEQ